MKKTYLARRNALLSARGMSWGVGALLFALIMLAVRLVAPDLFWKVVSPVFRAADALSSAGTSVLSSFGNAATLTRLNEQLRNDNASLALANQQLREQMGEENTQLTSGIRAGVVARPPTSPYDTLVVAVGEEAGARLGQEAFTPSGVPIGVVSAVERTFSRVTLFSAGGTRTDGWVGSASVPVTLLGTGAGTFEASAAHSAGILEGDVVSVPGPGQLPIGTVVRVDSDPLFPNAILRIRPVVNPFSLSSVLLRDTGIKGVSFATSTRP